MRKIYIDDQFICHTVNDGAMTAVDTDFFDGKCNKFVEGHRYIPSGSVWIRQDGAVFQGEMISPWKDYSILAAYQEQYEAMALNDDVIEKAAAYDILTEGAYV